MERDAVSLRRVMTGAALALLVLALGVTAVPLLVTRELGHASRALDHTLEQLGATEEVEVALLLHDRERQLQVATGDVRHAERAERALQDLQRWVVQLPREDTTPERTAALTRLHRAVQAYRAQRREAAAGAPGQAALSEAVEAAEALSEQHFRDAQAAIAGARRWRTVASAAGVTSGLLLLGGLAALLLFARGWLLRPLERFRGALAGFSTTLPPQRVPETGPAELRDISAAFNDLAARLARGREAQLGFLAGVAHDLRTPLGALKATAQRMHPSRPLPPEDTLREAFARVGRQVDRLDRMVEDLLDTARVEAGQLALQRAPHDLGRLVQEAVELHRDVSERHSLQLSLPPEPVSAQVDAVRVLQVLDNLLSNALKYSPAGGAVHVRLERAGDEARVSVQDEGVGIPAAEHASIFEPFHRAEASREHVPGVGLGLSVARRIAQAHGGHIRLQSVPGEGSTFTLHLPLAPAAAGASPLAGSASAAH